MTLHPMSVAPPTLIADWARYAGLDLKSAGAARQINVTFDRVRVQLLELPSQGILLESRIADLPMSASEVDRVVQRALAASTGRMRDSPVVLCANDDASALLLQLQVSPGADVLALNAAIEKLVNEVDVWRALL